MEKDRENPVGTLHFEEDLQTLLLLILYLQNITLLLVVHRKYMREKNSSYRI